MRKKRDLHNRVAVLEGMVEAQGAALSFLKSDVLKLKAAMESKGAAGGWPRERFPGDVDDK